MFEYEKSKFLWTLETTYLFIFMIYGISFMRYAKIWGEEIPMILLGGICSIYAIKEWKIPKFDIKYIKRNKK